MINIYCVLNRPIEYLYVENVLNWRLSYAHNIRSKGEVRSYCVRLLRPPPLQPLFLRFLGFLILQYHSAPITLIWLNKNSFI